ncbi:IclR family transcriptional regulator [Actinoplanes sp. NPDC051851]|uniref:IclR family transcriptional regulator n=1 Tax=Actinoplanes sp. NPDC051851 TaxID=3154753 RepID=UPI003422C5A1
MTDPSAGPSAGPQAGAPRVRGRRPPAGDPVVDRAMALLFAFGADHRRLTLTELSRRTGIPASSALRLANRLMAWGALERDPAGRFSIGLRLFEVASLSPRGHGLREVALPYMGDLAETTRHHVLLAVRDGDEAILVERISGRDAIPTMYRVGGRLPLHATGVGLVLLAHAGPAFQAEYLARPLVREPEQVPVDPAELRRTLAHVRRTQAVALRRNVIEPLMSVACPILTTDGEVVAALAAIVPEQKADPRRLIPVVQLAARSIGRSLDASLGVSPGTSPGTGA